MIRFPARSTLLTLMAFGGIGLGLAACSEGQDAAAPTEAGEASGEILEGSISDAMIPLEELKSSAPIAEPVMTSPTDSGEAEDAPEAADGPAAEPAPAADPVGDAID